MEGRKKIFIIIASVGALLVLVPVIALLLFSTIQYDEDVTVREKLVRYSGNEDIALDIGSKPSNGIATDRSFSNESKIVKTGNITKLVDNFRESEEYIRKISDENNGEITYSRDSGEGNKRVLDIEIKVSVNNFEKVFLALKDMAGENISSTTDMRDVTTEVMDLEARLKTLKSTESQFLEILKKADSVTDTVSVYKELNQVRAEIESLEGQLKYYSTKTDYSTIRVTLKQSSVGATLEDTPWKPFGVLKDAGRAYVSFLKIVGTILIYFVVFTAPLWVIYGMYRVIKKSSGK